MVTTELIRTDKSWDGVELPNYLQGKPEIVVTNLEDIRNKFARLVPTFSFRR